MRFLLIAILFSFNVVSGQISIDWPEQKLKKFQFKLDSVFSTWKDYNDAVQLLQNESYSKGLLEFSVDSLIPLDSNAFKAELTIGEVYQWDEIELVGKNIKTPNNIKGKWKGKIITPTQLIERIDQVSLYYQRNGFPFVKVHFDDLTSNKQSISGQLKIEPGPQIEWDTLAISGDATLSKYFLENYLNIQPGKLYDEVMFLEIKKKLKELPFVTLMRQPEIKFNKKTAIVQLSLNKKSANFINGVIGVLPNTSTVLTGDESQLVITGDVKLNLGNSFGYGEKIKINWRRLQAESQQLNTEEDIPFLFKTFVGLTHSLDLLKQDTTFINYKNRLGVKYDFSAKRSFTGFWENETTNTLSNEAIKNSSLSSVNGSKNAYGFKLFIDWLDYKFNPRKGFLMNLEGKAGIKNLSGADENGKVLIPINESDDITSYLLAPETSMIYEGKILLEGYIPLWKVISLKLANQSGFKQNDYMLDNDLYRLGGFSLLRGFDQQSIFASNYSIFTSEVRILFEENSFLNIFTDQSFLFKSTLTESESDFSSAYGAGINFQTKPGIFSISYALGKFRDTQIDFSSAKIHFGFINLF